MARRLPAPALVLAVALIAAGPGRAAEDRITVRGAYFREASTRVVQPMLEAIKTLPGGFDVGGHLLIDAISSASIAQGARTDDIFHENRYEGGLRVGHTWDLLRVGGFLRVSREPDYLSRTVGLSLSQEFWGRTGTVALNLARTWDEIDPPPQDRKYLEVYFAGLGYTQLLTPTTIAQVNYELFFQDGFIANPYISDPNLGREDVPTQRLRHVVAGRVAQYLPPLGLGAQLHYRFYLDQDAIGRTGPWGLSAHTLEARLYKDLGRAVELRLLYRYHRQYEANFWCNARPDNNGQSSCYGTMPEYHSWDVKFGFLRTDLVDLKVTWDLHLLRDLGPLSLFAGGSLDLSYGYYFQSSPYGAPFTDKTRPPVIGEIPLTDRGGAHVMQTGYTLPF